MSECQNTKAIATTEMIPVAAPKALILRRCSSLNQQHDDKQKKHNHRARINQDLHRSEKERMQQHEQPGHRDDRRTRNIALLTGLRFRMTNQRRRSASARQTRRRECQTMAASDFFHRKGFLRLRFVSLVLPFMNLVLVHPAQRQQFFLVINHFLPVMPVSE